MRQTTTPQADQKAPNEDSAPPTAGAGTSPTIEAREAGVRAMLVGFYFFLAPGVLTPADTPLLGAAVAERFWTVGTAALWLICAAWTVDLVRRGRSGG